MSMENRKAERLEASYRITVKRMGARQSDSVANMTNISQGGICFVSPLDLRQGDTIEIGMPAPLPVVSLKAKVIWSRPQKGEISVGAGFDEMSERLRTRLVEMHRAIKAYQTMKDADDSAKLDANQAAMEWLNLYGESFLRGAA